MGDRHIKDAVIIDAVRTPVARAHPQKGWFRNIRSDELGVIVVRELVRRVGIDPSEIEDVILGCATQSGEQAMNIARYISIMAGLPFKAGAQTINRQCASGLTAIHSAAQAIMAGQTAVRPFMGFFRSETIFFSPTSSQRKSARGLIRILPL